jgi:hypothetical protein
LGKLGKTWEMGENEKELTLEQLLKSFTPTQLDFVATRIMEAHTDKGAAEEIGISPDVVYAWPNKQDVNRAVMLAKLDGVSVAREKLQRLATKAVDKLGDAINKDDPALSALLAVLDRVGLPEVKRQELTGAGGGRLEVEFVNDWRGASGED